MKEEKPNLGVRRLVTVTVCVTRQQGSLPLRYVLACPSPVSVHVTTTRTSWLVTLTLFTFYTCVLLRFCPVFHVKSLTCFCFTAAYVIKVFTPLTCLLFYAKCCECFCVFSPDPY